jgi:hypothetical protein
MTNKAMWILWLKMHKIITIKLLLKFCQVQTKGLSDISAID